MVYRFVSMRMGRHHPDLEDVVQEVLISAASSLPSLRAEHDGAVPKWFLTIARHKVADHQRRALTRPVSSPDGDVATDTASAQVDVQEIVTRRDRERRLREAMRQLTPEQEEILVMRFILDFGIVQVATITGRTVGAVKALQHRGLASLEKLLAGQEGWR